MPQQPDVHLQVLVASFVEPTYREMPPAAQRKEAAEFGKGMILKI